MNNGHVKIPPRERQLAAMKLGGWENNVNDHVLSLLALYCTAKSSVEIIIM